MLDIIEIAQIDILAAKCTEADHPNFDGRLCDILTDAHVEKALTEYFSECEEWSDALLPQALKAYRESVEANERINGFATGLIGSVLAGAL